MRAAIAIAVLSVFLVGCGTNMARYSFETQPRSPLEAAGMKSARGVKMDVSPSGMISLIAVYDDNGTSRVGFTMSHDGADNFAAVRAISPESVKISAHGENDPELAVAGRNIYALWEQTHADGTRDIVMASSPDMGQRFDTPVKVNDNTTPSFHGFASLAVAPDGDVYVAWLDGREKVETPGTFAVYLARSTDRGATFGKNVRVAPGACPCCRPAVAIGANGEVFVAWRKVFPGSIRDFAVSTSHDNGQTFSASVRVAEDGWQIHGCPESGASLAVAKGKLYIAWMTAGDDGRGRIRVATSGDGAHFSRPNDVATDIRDPNHPQLAATQNGSVFLCFQGRPARKSTGNWSESVALVAPIEDGKVGAEIPLANGGKTASYPALAAGPAGDLFVAWTASGGGADSILIARGARQ